MPTFHCRAIDPSGGAVERSLDCNSQTDAQNLLELEGLVPVSIKSSASKKQRKAKVQHNAQEKVATPKRRGGRRVKRKDLLPFCNQMLGSLTAGLPLVQALESARDQSASQELARCLDQIVDEIRGGSQLNEALARHPRAFPPFMVGVIEAGETSGSLDSMFESLGENLERSIEARSEVQSAVMYPAITMTVLGLAISVLLLFIVPRFAEFYSRLGSDLPLATRILIGVGTTLRSSAWLMALGLVGFFFGSLKALRVPRIRRQVDFMLLRIPILGRVFAASLALQFLEMFGLLYKAGLPAVRAFETLVSSMPHALYREGLSATVEGISVGQSLGEALSKGNFLPDGVRQMIAHGEQTGSLDQVCEGLARQTRRELKYLTKNTTTWIEPILTLVLGAVVLFVALAAFLPMWNLVSAVK